MNRDSASVVEKGARVLVRLPNWLGDVLMCTPSLSALVCERPDLELTALVKPGMAPVAKNLPGVTRVLLVEDTGFRGTLALAAKLRTLEFDAAFVFPKGFREALLVRLARIPLRIGLDTDHRGFLFSDPVRFTRDHWLRHHTEQFGRVLSPLDIDPGAALVEYTPSPEDRDRAAGILERAGLSEQPFAVYHVTASKLPRAWHPDRFAQVALRLHEEAGLQPVLLGVESDAPVHEAFCAACPKAVDLRGQTSLPTMAAILERAALFAGSDSGPMHLAAAVGAPVVAVFGPGAPDKTAPRLPDDRIRVIYADLPCSPCRQSFWKDCRPSSAGKPPCMEAIHPSAVAEAALSLLGASRKQSG